MGARKSRRIVDIEVGTEVVALDDGWGERKQRGRYGSEWVKFYAGDRLIVRGVTPDGALRVRRRGGLLFVVGVHEVEHVDGSPFRFLGDVPEGGIAPDDPRLDWLWRDAALLATATGHCYEYDRLVGGIGIPGRVRAQQVSIEVAPGVRLTGSVRARSAKEAEALMIEQVRRARPAALAIEAGS